MATTTHYLNNGEDTWVFNITGEAAELYKVTRHGYCLTVRSVTTRQEAREFWTTAFRLAPNFMAKGSVMPASVDITKRLKDAIDPNWAEAELALAQG